MDTILNWTFSKECQAPKDIEELLVEGEYVVAAYQTIRDIALFTNKRIIVRDAQGITGKKIEVYSLPYSSILMYSTENAGSFLDINSEVELWTRLGQIKINLSPKADIRKLDKILAEAILL